MNRDIQAYPAEIITRLVWSGPENAHTELLAELLRISDLQRSFLAHVLGLSSPIEGTLKVATQVVNSIAHGQPHLSLDGRSIHILVESKLTADLTPNQPVEYLKELSNRRACSGGEAALAFLVPQARKEEIEQKLWSRLGYPGRRDNPGTYESITLRVVTWEETATSFRDVVICDPVFSFLRDSFVALVSASAGLAPIPLTLERRAMLNKPEVIETFIAVAGCLSDLRSVLGSRGEKLSKPATGTDLTWVGFYSEPDGQSALKVWIGFFYRAAHSFSRGPLWLQLNGTAFDESVLARLRAEQFELYSARGFPGWGGVITPLKLASTESGTEQAQYLLAQIDRIRACAST